MLIVFSISITPVYTAFLFFIIFFRFCDTVLDFKKWVLMTGKILKLRVKVRKILELKILTESFRHSKLSKKVIRNCQKRFFETASFKVKKHDRHFFQTLTRLKFLIHVRTIYLLSMQLIMFSVD